MKTKPYNQNHSLGVAALVGAFLLAVSSASAQNLYVSDYGSTVYSITPGGVQSTVATGMNYPFGLTFDGSGDLFVANSANNGPGGYIGKITPGGTQSTFATGIDTVALAFNSSGDLFAAGYNDGNIYEYTPGGVRSTFATGFFSPISMTFNSAGDLFVGSGYGAGNGAITEITPGGTKTPFAAGLSFPCGLAFNSAGILFASSQNSGTIFEYAPGGTQSTFTTLSATTGVNGLAVDNAGDLFAAAANTGKIIKITPGGVQSTFASITPGIPSGLVFQPTPEPSVLGLMGMSAVVFVAYRHKKNQMAKKA